MNDIEKKETNSELDYIESIAYSYNEKIEPNQESITKTFNDIKIIFKSILLVSLIMLIFTLIIGIFRSI